MRKDTAKSSAFDINLGRKYRAIGAEISRINARQNELLEKYAGNLSPVQSELTANARRLAELEQAAHALVPFDAVAFEKYAPENNIKRIKKKVDRMYKIWYNVIRKEL